MISQRSHHQISSSTIMASTQSCYNSNQNTALIVIYIANILVTAFVGSVALFATSKAPKFVFSQAFIENESMKIVGAFWIAIGIVSAFGLYNPIKFSPILIIQIIYKGLFLLVSVLPNLINGQKVPIGMAAFFLVWVIVLPFIVPWKILMSK